MGKRVIEEKASAQMHNDPIENEWQSLFVVTEHWRSDSIFFADEIRFLRSLIDKYFIWLIEDRNIQKATSLVNSLVKLENRRVINDQNLKRHLEHLTALVEDPFSHDAQLYLNEHAGLESSMSDFLKDFRTLKTEVFKLAEEIIDSEKSKHLLGR